MSIRRLSIALSLVLVSAVSVARASDAIDSDTKKAARELMDATSVEKHWNEITPMLARQFSGGDPDFVEAFEKFFKKTMPFSKVESRITEIYGRNFSKEELKAVTEFYKTPTGKKVLEKMPVVVAESMQLSQQLVAENQAELKKLAKELEAKKKKK